MALPRRCGRMPHLRLGSGIVLFDRTGPTGLGEIVEHVRALTAEREEYGAVGGGRSLVAAYCGPGVFAVASRSSRPLHLRRLLI
jgi:hypothetical protein